MSRVKVVTRFAVLGIVYYWCRDVIWDLLDEWKWTVKVWLIPYVLAFLGLVAPGWWALLMVPSFVWAVFMGYKFGDSYVLNRALWKGKDTPGYTNYAWKCLAFYMVVVLSVTVLGATYARSNMHSYNVHLSFFLLPHGLIFASAVRLTRMAAERRKNQRMS